ncbi:MAG: DNA polymerase III subunit delta' [Legionellaceae bacterium]
MNNDYHYSYYPWQKRQWDTLISLKIKEKIPHALLFSGYPGLGKLHFTQHLVKALLCSEQEVCHVCRNCQLYEANNHPDYTFISIDEEKTKIKIEDIRRIIHIAQQTPQQAQRKIIVMAGAEKMNHYAANAFLKILEEPPGLTVFILITQALNLLPSTIRSRCQIFHFTPPSLKEGSAWLMQQTQETQQHVELLLSLANYAPLFALELNQSTYLIQRTEILMDWTNVLEEKLSIVSLVEKWNKKEIKIIIKWIQYFIIDSIRLSSGVTEIINKDILESLQRITAFFTVFSLYLLLDKVCAIIKILNESTTINTQFLLEDFLITGLHLKK